MEFNFNDGGRADAGYKGRTGDCVTRAVAIAAELPYQEVYNRLAEGNANQRVTKRSRKTTARQKTASHGISTTRKWFKDYMKSLGFEWVSTMGIGTGCKVHLKSDELPSGRVIARVTRHYCAVIDGAINDTYNPSRDETRCFYGYWIKQ